MAAGFLLTWRLPIRKASPILWFVLLALWVHFGVALFLAPLVSNYYAQGGSTDDSARYITEGKTMANLILRDPMPLLKLFFERTAFNTPPSAFQWGISLFALISGGTTHGIRIVCAWLGIMGAYHFVRAYIVCLKSLFGWVWYAFLVLFFPSVIFWLTLPLKDVFTFWALGLLTFSSASYFQQRTWWNGLKIVLAELVCVAIRPYFGIFFLPPLLAWLIMDIVPNLYNRRVQLWRLFPLFLINALLLYFLLANSFFLGMPSLSLATEYQVAASGEEGSRLAGSTLIPPIIQPNVSGFNILAYMAERSWLVFSVLYRPLPWEAHNSFALISSLENTVLLFLSTLTIWRVKLVIMMSWRSPLLWFACFVAMLFVGVYSFQIFNLGTMARARTNVLPFLFFFFSIALDSIYPARRWAERLFA